MALQGAVDTARSPALPDKAGDWPLMPGERLVWTGRPCAFSLRAWGRLALRIILAGLVAVMATLLAREVLAVHWTDRNVTTRGDLQPLSDWHATLTVIAGFLAAAVLATIVLIWLSAQARLARTRYAITDRRIIELCRRRSRTEIRCLSRAAAAPQKVRGGRLIVGTSPHVNTAAAGTLIAAERLVLQALGPDGDTAFAALLSQRERRQGDNKRTDTPPGQTVWVGGAVHGVIWDWKLLGQVSSMLFVLFFVLIGIAMMIGGSAAFFGYPTALTPEGSEEPSAIETLLFGAFWLFITGSGFTWTLRELRTSYRRRQSRQFRVAAGTALVVPDCPFGGAASCPILPDMRIDLWLGRRPHLHFVGRVDESEGSKSLTRVGFDAPADPMGAYMALVAARDVAARAQSGGTGAT
jgi:hypothetical protein